MSVASLLERLRGSIGRRGDGGTNVAIACQGGGSHAAFTAGVLARLLSDLPDSRRIVGLSGASGGAVSASAAWYGLRSPDETPESVLTELWDDIAASAGWESWVNELTLLTAQASGTTTYGSRSPYRNPTSDWGRRQLERVLTDNIDFAVMDELADDATAPALLISAVDVRSGEPVVFRTGEVTPGAVVASAAVPQLFEAVEIDGDYHWDGFLSQNPPVVEFLTDDTMPPVEELWVIRLSSKTTAELPTSADQIDERTRELVENLSLTQELRFVETVSEWVADGTVTDDGLAQTDVEVIELHREQSDRSRLNRRSSFISDLYADGEAEARNFLTDLRAT